MTSICYWFTNWRVSEWVCFHELKLFANICNSALNNLLDFLLTFLYKQNKQIPAASCIWSFASQSCHKWSHLIFYFLKKEKYSLVSSCRESCSSDITSELFVVELSSICNCTLKFLQQSVTWTVYFIFTSLKRANRVCYSYSHVWTREIAGFVFIAHLLAGLSSWWHLTCNGFGLVGNGVC